MQADLTRLADAGIPTAACEEPASSTSAAAREALEDSEFTTADLSPLPDWCTENAFTGWWYTRTGACDISSRILTVYNTNTGAVTGTMNFLQLTYSYTSTSIPTWALQIEISPFTQTGTAVGSSAQGTGTCSGACTTASSSFPSQPVGLSTDAEGEAFFDTTAVAAGAVGTASTNFNRFFTNPTWTTPSTPVNVTPPVNVRCDNATAGATSVGCVFHDYEPAFSVSLSGVAPSFARHLSDAQASGLPGAYPGGPPLTRLTDAVLSDRNGNTACPQEASGGYPRPAGFSCDEYPFRSTWEGAFISASPPSPGRTFDWCQITSLSSGSGPVGWSACMIPATENSSGGGSLGAFYRSERVIELDKFYVWVVD
ncbi:hypothetical protein [Streptomyces sp. NBC_00658]|uniref:NucA/NucB deoxyribonuclease domain-containing protein n=1 Tax=Streptomyces sp. NBC_00658 TaxID=2975800 RepID=UPI0032468242